MHHKTILPGLCQDTESLKCSPTPEYTLLIQLSLIKKNAHLSVAIFTFNECEKVKQAGTSNDNYEECLLPETISLFYIEKYMNYRHRSYHQQLFEKLIGKNFNLSRTHARTYTKFLTDTR